MAEHTGDTRVMLPQPLELLISQKRFGDIKKSKNTFPVVCSTLASDALALLVYSSYEIELVKNCQFWRRGLSDVYLVETLNELYILRVSHHHWRSQSEIEFELEFLDF